MEHLTIRRLTETDTDAATVLATKVQLSEFTQNPPFINLGLKNDIRDNYILTKSLLQSGYSYGAFDGDKLIAVGFGHIQGRNEGRLGLKFDNSEKPDSSVTDDERERAKYYLSKLYIMIRLISEKVDLFNHYNVDVAMSCRGLFVDDEYKNQGLGLRLMKHVIDTAVERGIRCVYTSATGAFSARIFEKLGFEKLSELRYDEFLDDGKPVFVPPAPHYSLGMWAKCYPQ